MSLTPDAIVNYPLRQAVRGYAIGQVDELLDRIADELEGLHEELRRSRREAELAAARTQELEETESTLKRTLITAQRAAEQVVQEAHQKAAAIIEEAERDAVAARAQAEERARSEERNLQRRIDALRSRVQALRAVEADYRRDLRQLMESHLVRLDELAVVEPSGAELDESPPLEPAGEPGEVPSDADGDQPADDGQPAEDLAGPAHDVGDEGTDDVGDQDTHDVGGAQRAGEDVALRTGDGSGARTDEEPIFGHRDRGVR